MVKKATMLAGSWLILSMASGLAANLDQLTILGPNYPRVFYFRASEAACSVRRYPTYESWERNFDRLMGIMGKCLDEECIGRMPRNPEFFTRFKLRHPKQVVLLHFNGNSRDPIFERENYFPGHWIYRRAVMITQDVPAASGQSVIKVADARAFRANTGRYHTSNDDIALFGIKNGKHDWYHCEQVQLVAVDYAANTITVKRGCYGTKPLAFKAGQARAAAHAVEGPWGRHNNRLWFYNYSTHCPKDKNGKTCSDVLVDGLARWFGKGGPLEAFDGIEFDVLFNGTRGDTDGDGKEDNGLLNGRNNYGIGVVEFGKKLRARMGDDFIIQADGALGKGGLGSQRCWEIFNGIESEGWPNLSDWEIGDWSGGLNRHFFWRQNAHKPAFSYINHKWVQSVPGRPGRTRQVDVPFSRHRLVFAAAQFYDSMICYSSAPRPPASTGYTFWQRDVSVPPNASLLFSIGMGAKSPERSDGVWFKVYAAEIRNGKPGPFVKLSEESSKQHKWLPQTVSLAQYAGQAVRLKFVADCGPSDDATTDHASWGDVRIKSGRGVVRLVSEQLPVAGMCIRGRAEEPINPKTGAHLTYEAHLAIDGRSLPGYSVHPPYRSLRESQEFPVWDEFVRGADHVLGWLGRPDAPAVRVALSAPDLLEGAGHGRALARLIKGRVAVSVEGEGVAIRPSDARAKKLAFAIRNIPTRGPDLYVSLTMKAAPMEGYPREMARFVKVMASGGMIDLVAREPDETGMCLRGRGEEPLDRSTGAAVSRGPRTVGGKSLPTVFAHPPWKHGTGYTYWCQEIDVPPRSELRFSIGMAVKSPQRSDGVWFKVYAAVVAAQGIGRYEKIFEKSSKAYRWLPQTVSLAKYAGKCVRLKFVADAGPRDNSTTDQAHWGAVRIVARGVSESEVTRPAEYMTWANDKPFTSGFYFRHIRSPQIDLAFTVESTEPVVLQSITVHAYPDVMYRVFEKGLVLANPSLRPYTFDLRSITPERRYRRLRATEFQDRVANNGEPVGDRVTLGERDALFLVRTD